MNYKIMLIFLLIILFLNLKNNIKETFINYKIDDLNLIFNNLTNYVVIRRSSEFPKIKQGSDIDILTTELNKNYKIIQNLNLNIFTKKPIIINDNVKQIDLYLDGNFFVKLNFTNLVIDNNKFSLHQNLTKNIIKNREETENNNIKFYIPNKIDDIAIRYCEYKNKDKLKHLGFVKKSNILFNKLNEDIKKYNINYNETGKQKIHKFNFFLVWSHGLKKIVEIIDMINELEDLDIVYIKKKKIDNLDELISNIYKFDTMNVNHIKSKTKYIKNLNNTDIIIILCVNKDYQEENNSVKFCRRVNKLKWDIREKYNPIHENKNFYIDKLSKGITHNHVIHGNDTEREVFHIFKYLKLENPFYYIKNSNITERVNGDFHLNEFSNFNIEFVDVNKIRCNIVNKPNIRIEETPHYKFVNGQEEEYISYFKNFIGEKLTQNHTPNRFRSLIRKLDYKNYNKNNYYLIIVNKNYIIQDGLHRISILKSKGINYIKLVIK
jgi:hypothetical protein